MLIKLLSCLFICLMLSSCNTSSQLVDTLQTPSPSPTPSSLSTSTPTSTPTPVPSLNLSSSEILPPPIIDPDTPIGRHGALSVEGITIKDAQNSIFQLRGLSTHSLSAYSKYLNPTIFTSLRDDFHCNAIRLALYIDYNAYYLENQVRDTQTLEQAIQDATNCGLYVIVDWHLLQDKNPLVHQEDALTFFDYISSKYRHYPNILYEICNEPNGSNISWSDHIKPYATKIVPTIRKNAPDSLIIIGTPHWCQSPLSVFDDPIEGTNLLFAFHFYAASHGSILRSQLETTLSAKSLPIIVSEFGTSESSGDGMINEGETQKWITLLNQYHVSFFNWSLCDKDESSALLLPHTPPNQPISDSSLTASGKFIKQVLSSYPEDLQ